MLILAEGGIEMNNQVTFFEDSAEGWERALFAILAVMNALEC